MNYFAHARVATGLDGSAAFVLGAMLPDFAHMIGDRIRALGHPALRSGERLHRKTDAIFHESEAFRACLREASHRLQNEGVARGPARGAAHVGVELLLDAALVGDPRADAAYLAALDAAPGLSASIRWGRPESPVRWQRLQARLVDSGLPHALRDPARVTERVARTLHGRPRLRLAPHEHAIVRRWAGDARARVERSAPRMLEETLAALLA